MPVKRAKRAASGAAKRVVRHLSKPGASESSARKAFNSSRRINPNPMKSIKGAARSAVRHLSKPGASESSARKAWDKVRRRK